MRSSLCESCRWSGPDVLCLECLRLAEEAGVQEHEEAYLVLDCQGRLCLVPAFPVPQGWDRV